MTFLELRNESTKECFFWKRKGEELTIFRCPLNDFKSKSESIELKEEQLCLMETLKEKKLNIYL